MQYRKLGNTGLNVSALGMGMMRLPLEDGSQGYTGISSGRTDVGASVSMLRHAVDSGINYVDTAFNYLDGDSEKITGLALAHGYREKVILATKAPVWLYRSPDDFDRYLEEQLHRLQTDYVDVYLLHGINKVIWEKKILRHDVLHKLEQAKAAGKIRFIGFSFHDSLEAFQSIIDSYGHWDLCQIQLNYCDTQFQAGLEGLQYAHRRGAGVSIMEPLKGGYLARLPQMAMDVFALIDKERSAAEWAFDYLWNMQEVGTVLSGMGSIAQINENIAYADRASVQMLTEQDLNAYQGVCGVLGEYATIPCTGCAYCIHCPQRVAVPYCFFAYNIYQRAGDIMMARKYYHEQLKAFGNTADVCSRCGKCEEICPQNIPIRKWLPIVAALMEGQ